MMDIDKYEHGVPSWVDVSSPDLARTKEFYSALFGWEIPNGPPEAGGYSLAMVRGRTVAGVSPQMNPAAPPAWTSYVNVDSVDGTVKLVADNGGTVLMPPMDVMDAGRMAIFADPVGAVIGLWEPGNHTGAQVVNEAGTYSWSELLTTDVERSKAFYGAVFGWTPKVHGDGPDAYVEFEVGGRSIAGMMLKPPSMPAEIPSYWGVYFTVDDADAAAKRVAELGGTVMMGPMDIEPGRFAGVIDPTGAMFSVIRFSEQPS
jgi:predicted enzyme related to lactoylglutathione lyase